MGISGEKIWVAVGLAAISSLLGIVPLFFRRKLGTPSLKLNLFLSFLSSFGGGVLLATAIIHMLPHLRERISRIDTLTDVNDGHFPFSEVMVMIGFALIYFIEEIAHYIVGDENHIGHGHSHNHGTSVFKDSSIVKNTEITESNSGIVTIEPENEKEVKNKLTKAKFMRGILALVALSFHGILEGVAVGVQEDGDVWLLFGAVASHEFIISFCMGLELMLVKVKATVLFVSVISFSMISSIGILIGATLTSTESTDTTIIALIEGIATGTILYVVFFEIMIREREKKNKELKGFKWVGFLQFAALVFGLFLMTILLTQVGSHDHGHDHGDHEDDCHHDHDHFIKATISI